MNTKAQPLSAAPSDPTPRSPEKAAVLQYGDLAKYSAKVDDLNAAAGASIRGTTAWIRGLALPEQTRLLTVFSTGGDLDAFLPLQLDPQAGVLTTCGAAHAHYALLASRHHAATVHLADALRAWTAHTPTICHVQLGPLRADDTAWTLADRLHEWLTPTLSEPVPVLVRDARDHAESYLSDSMRRTLRKARNRLHSDGRHFEITVTTEPAEVIRALPGLAILRRNRDHERGLTSPLDTTESVHRWQRWLTTLTTHRLQLSTLTIDHDLAAYVLAVNDIRHYRVIEGFFATKHSRYAPGRLLETACLQHMLDQGQAEVLDWMTSTAPEALLAYNNLTPTIALRSRSA